MRALSLGLSWFSSWHSKCLRELTPEMQQGQRLTLMPHEHLREAVSGDLRFLWGIIGFLDMLVWSYSDDW